MSVYKLRIHNLSKHFDHHRVFDKISLTHGKGVLGIAGPNGSGKSTLLQCIAGLQRPSTGTIEWLKKEQPIELSSLKQQIGYAAPYINLYPELNCTENLQFLLKLRDISSNELVKQALQFVGAGELESQLFGKLSTGQQQRLRLAAAIIHQPEILMLDEPGSNLDKKGRSLIESLVNTFRDDGKTVIIASNNPKELNLCDAVYSVEEEGYM